MSVHIDPRLCGDHRLATLETAWTLCTEHQAESMVLELGDARDHVAWFV